MSFPTSPQILSNSSVATGVGVYWMFYAGGSFEPADAPDGVAGLPAGQAVEGLRLDHAAKAPVRTKH